MAPSLPQPIINIIGQRVALGPRRSDLAPLIQSWNNDFAIMRTLGELPRPQTLEQIRSGYEQANTTENDMRFLIYETSTWQPVGITRLFAIDFRHRTADYAILIGEAAARGCGYGTETTHLVLDYAFTTLELHNVLLTVFEFNVAGMKAYGRAGFREIGRRREAVYSGGRYWDVIYMDCLASEYVQTGFTKSDK